MKRHNDDIANKNKRFSFDNRPPMPPTHSPGTYYPYQSSHWPDPRTDHTHKTIPNMSNMFSPQQNLMMPWNGTNNPPPQSPSPNHSLTSFSPIYNPLQPPPPLPMDRPPMDVPPPPPGINQMPRRNINMNLNNNMRRKPPPISPMRTDASNFINPYKKNNMNPMNLNLQKNGNAPPIPHPGPSPKPKSDKSEDGDKLKPPLKVNKKARRKPMSERYTCKKEWNKDDAIKALTLENAYNHLIKKVPMLILRFPDPELNKGLIHSYSPAIETVHFQQPSRARYCFVQLKADADVEKVKEEISQIPFGTGKISVENKITRHEVAEVTPEQLDPYTLYVGNLPTKLNVTIFKEKFPTAKRIDIGYAQRTKFTRYAFLHYDNVDESMEAFKSTYNLTIDARSLVVRFRRNKGSVGLSEKVKRTKKDENVDGEGSTKNDGDKTKPSKLFDDDVDNKTNVLEKAEELRKSGYGISLNNNPKENLFGSKIKEEPIEYEEDDDECNSDEFADEFGGGYGDPYDDDHFSDYEGSDNDYDGNDPNDYDSSEPKQFGRRHWERAEQPITKFKEEKPDEYNAPVKATTNEPKKNDKQQEKDDLDDLFNDLNPDDGGFDL